MTYRCGVAGGGEEKRRRRRHNSMGSGGEWRRRDWREEPAPKTWIGSRGKATGQEKEEVGFMGFLIFRY